MSDLLLLYRNLPSVKLGALLYPCHLQDFRGEVNVSSHNRRLPSFWYSWPADNEEHIGVFFKDELLTATEAVLAQVEAVVATIDNICVLKLLAIFENFVDLPCDVVNRNKGLCSGLIMVVEFPLLTFVQMIKMPDFIDTRSLLSIDVTHPS